MFELVLWSRFMRRALIRVEFREKRLSIEVYIVRVEDCHCENNSHRVDVDVEVVKMKM
jgi:hypothetical protein